LLLSVSPSAELLYLALQVPALFFVFLMPWHAHGWEQSFTVSDEIKPAILTKNPAIVFGHFFFFAQRNIYRTGSDKGIIIS